MKIGWVSPLPPSPSGIGDYSADLLPEVSRICPTIAFTDQTSWDPPPGCEIDIRSFADLPGAIRGEEVVPIYHQGNNPYHTEIYDLAWSHPGVLVLHDVVLHHFLLDRAARTKDWKMFHTLLDEQYPEVADDLLRLRRKAIASELEKFLFPLSGPLIRRSDQLVVHSSYAGQIARLEVPDASPLVIPHHMGIPPAASALDPFTVRRKLAVPDDSFLIGTFGYITLPKQADVLLNALRAALDTGVPATVVFVGKDESQGSLDRLIEDLDLKAAVRRVGYLDRAEFYDYMAAMEVVVSLRYPSAGETSGTLSRALSLGKCLIVNDYASFADIPLGACERIPVFGEMTRALTESLIKLSRDPNLRDSIGAAARSYADKELSIKHCAALYVKAAQTSTHGREATVGNR